MPTYHVVIADADLANLHDVVKHATALASLNTAGVPIERLKAIARELRAPRPVGTIHAESVATECPDCATCGISHGAGAPPAHHAMALERGCVTFTARPNCRNCGDPAHADTCKAAGHCPHCGTRHGLAPDATVAANGYRLEPA